VENTLSEVAAAAGPQATPSPLGEVTLDDGTRCDLTGLGADELKALHWEQELALTRRILDAPKGSRQRAEAVRHAYDTANRIVAARTMAAGKARSSDPVLLGLHPRYGHLVVDLLSRRRARGLQANFFEVGYGSGALLKQVSEHRFPVAGIEVSTAMRDQARQLLGPSHQQDLLLGDFIRHEFAGPEHRYGLIYWNDVFEHIPPDEIADYLEKIHGLLVGGGQLVTITPNWHTRPSDITAEMCPPRTEAAGLHLKEYTLREVTRLLRRAGFRRVAVPLVVMPGQFVLCGHGLAGLKRALEPCLEFLPFRLAKLLCRGFGLCCTVATKGR
jgi:SAM-dependent methyltransferase